MTGVRVADPAVVRAMLSVMATCGMYDGAGEWLFDIGLPAKSGVSGGILAVLPGQLGIAVYSPPLDPRGNSVRGVAVCRELAAELDLHLVADGGPSGEPIRTRADLRTRRSTRVRPALPAARLVGAGADVLVLELQGELTFLVAETVARAVAERPSLPRLVLLDLRRVGRLDRGAGPMLDGLAASLAATGGQLVLAGRAETLARLSGPGAGHQADGAAGAILRFPDIDSAIEWAEDRLLGLADRDAAIVPAIPLGEHDLVAGLPPASVERLRGYLDGRRWRAGEIVVRRGDPTDELFLLTSGEATASVDLAGGGRRRLSTIGAGSVLGELAFLGGTGGPPTWSPTCRSRPSS